ncbi:hypothetical protein FRC08_011660 [Ceratobasidium sp. 394]|nr:hypothetical protein FRC08_011660 [Ceratobasidium sp. 394]
MNTAQPSRSFESTLLFLSFVDFTSTRPTRPQPTPTRASGTRTAVLSSINTLSLVTDPTAHPEPLATIPSAPTTTTEAHAATHMSRASVLILAIALPVLTTLIFGGLLVWYLLRRRRRRRAEPTSYTQPNVPRRPRRLSEFWSADASKPESRSTSVLATKIATTPASAPTSAQTSPRTPNENTRLLRQDGAIRRSSRSMELIVAAGLVGGDAGNPSLAPNGVVDHYAAASNGIQQPMSADCPEPAASNRNADVEQQQMVEFPGVAQPWISKPHLSEPRTSTKRAKPISPLALPSPLYSTTAKLGPEHIFEPPQRAITVSRPSPPPSRREFSDLTFISLEPFSLDDYLLPSPATQSLYALSRFESPTRPSISSAEPRPSFSSSHLPYAPRPSFQSDTSRAMVHLHRAVSHSTYLYRTSSNSSTTNTFSTARTPKPNVLLSNLRHPPNVFAPGYFTRVSPKADIFDRPQMPETPSAMSVRSNPFYLWSYRNGSGSLCGTESELDGVRYSREDGRSSPALPDSVRTSVLSFFEKRR